MSLDRVTIQESRQQYWLNRQTAEELLKRTEMPYVTSTPLIKAQIPNAGTVLIKDESKNPTGTIKDRIAQWVIDFCVQEARDLTEDEEARDVELPRVSVITAGNTGIALAYSAQKYGLPPPKLLLDSRTPKKILNRLVELDADVYTTDLKEQELTAEDILELTNNPEGLDLTSVKTNFYALLIKSLMVENPAEIYVPYGSGTLYDELVRAQRTPETAIFGVKPLSQETIADKLVAWYNPFAMDSHELRLLKAERKANRRTGTYRATDDRMREAQQIMEQYCPAEISATAGLAAYRERWKRGLIKPDAKIIVVNTGKGQCQSTINHSG